MSSTSAGSTRSNVLRVAAGMLALATGGLLLLTACGSDASSDTGTPQGGAASQSAGAGQGGAGGGGNFTSGLIADVSGKTLQVQGTDSQTAVTYTSKTTFSQQTKVSAGAVRAGMCVLVQSGDAAGAAATATVAASSVSLSAAVQGECTGRGGMGGARGSGGPSGMPSGAPSGAPQGGQSGPQGGRTPGTGGSMRGGGVNGKVTAVSGSTITVASTAFGDTKSQTYTVTTTGKTTFTQELAAKASAVQVGKCATAVGRADSTGSVTATSIALRPATDGKCTLGIGRPSGARNNG